MRQLLPRSLPDADLDELLERDDRTPPAQRPWVMANMVSSVDGAFALDGRSGGLSSTEDRQIFHRLRAAADVVLVAAGTARAEGYRRPRTTDPELVEDRARRGLAADPRLCLVSRSLFLPEDLPLLSGPGQVPLVLHPHGADVDDVPEGVELRPTGEGDDVDLSAGLRALHDDGARVVLCEGGPSLLGQLHTEGLLDELFISTAPAMVGGAHVGLLGPAPETMRVQRLHRLLEAGGYLFATYRTVRS